VNKIRKIYLVEVFLSSRGVNQRVINLSKKKSRKSKKQKSKVKVYAGLILGLAILITIIYLLFTGFQESIKVAARVNGELISYKEIETLYKQLPEEYKGIITKDEILEQKINEKLLLQEATKKEITATGEEVDEIISTIIDQSGMTRREFESRLKQQGISQGKLKEYYKVQLIILKLLNETTLGDIEVEEREIRSYYVESGVKDSGVALEDARQQIEMVLLAQKREEAFIDYLEELRSSSTIEILFGIETFQLTERDTCKEGGKPIIRMFTTSKCEKCGLVEEAFMSAIETYNNEIVAYNWELDTGDNKLTLKKESSIPKSEAELFKSVSQSLEVPAFIFGCKYVRVGTGFDDLASEQSEFNSVINKLLAE
jgi:hypothetical protein